MLFVPLRESRLCNISKLRKISKHFKKWKTLAKEWAWLRSSQCVYILFANMDGIMILLWLMLYLELQKLLQREKDMMIAHVGLDISSSAVKPFSKFYKKF